MKIIIFLFILLNTVWAQDLRVVKLLKNDRFIIPKKSLAKKGAKFYIYNNDILQGQGIILACKTKSCLAKVTKKNDGFNFQLSMVAAFKLKPTKPKSKNKIYAGSFGLGYQAGYIKEFGEKLQMSFGGVLMATTIGNVGISGYGGSIGASYNIYKFGNFSFPLILQLDGVMTTLDFATLTSSGFIFIGSAFQTAKYSITNSLDLGFGLGLGYNTFKTNYLDENDGLEYTAPFAGVFMAFALYAEYAF